MSSNLETACGSRCAHWHGLRISDAEKLALMSEKAAVLQANAHPWAKAWPQSMSSKLDVENLQNGLKRCKSPMERMLGHTKIVHPQQRNNTQ